VDRHCWTQDSPDFEPESAGLSGVAATSADNAWVVGTYGLMVYFPLIEHWNGTAWTQVPSPDPGSDGDLHAVAATSADTAWAVGGTTEDDTSQTLIDRFTLTAQPAGPIVSGYRATKCVTDNDGSSANGTPVVLEDCNGTTQQNWTASSDGTIRINGKCLDIYRDEKASKAPVELWTCTGAANQEWIPVKGTLVNPISGRCLDDPAFNITDSTHLEIYNCNGGSNQQWTLP
jgi:hypothetical protein